MSQFDILRLIHPKGSIQLIPFASKTNGKLRLVLQHILHFVFGFTAYTDRSDRCPSDFFIMNQMEFRLIHNQKENCHYNHIPFKFENNQTTIF